MRYRAFLVAFLALSCISFAQPNTKSVSVTFSTLDVPGAGYTGIFGINSAGDMVGNYGQDTNQDSHGFLYRDGTFHYYDYPDESVTLLSGINDSGLMLGYAGTTTVVSFFYDGTTLTTFRDGFNSATFSNGLNNAGVVVGAVGTIYTTEGFKSRNGQFKTLNVPGSYTYVRGSGINNLGTIAGWTDLDGFICRGNNCKIVDYPGAGQTAARGINDAGIVVGWYSSSSCSCAFAAKNGKFVSFGYPGAAFTGAAGINNLGQVVGQYTFDYKTWHGFVTDPITSAAFDW